MSNKVSIIIPIYNAEKYLINCIESLLGQTYLDTEVVLIDDGSSDGSDIIIKQYIAKDERIKVMYLANNQGVSKARNVGIEMSSGDYILFMDADDVARNDMVEQLMRNIIRFDSSVATCEFIQLDEGLRLPDDKDNHTVSLMDSEKFLSEVMYGQKLDSGPWAKLFKRSVVADARFNEDLSIGEDLDFLCSIFSSQQLSIAHSDRQLYGYRVHADSVMGRGYSDKYREYMDMVVSWGGRLVQKYPSIESAIRYRIFGIASDCIGKIGSNMQMFSADYKLYSDQMRKHSISVLFNPRSSRKNRILALMYAVNARAASWIRVKARTT